MSYCVSCGIETPDSQRVCSMCYGDVGYGSDGHYERWAREQMEREEERQQEPHDED